MGKDVSIDIINQMLNGLFHHKEMLAAAYYTITDVHPSEVELVEEPIDECLGGRRWYFRRRLEKEEQMSQAIDTDARDAYLAAKELLATYGIATIAAVDLKFQTAAIENMARRITALEGALSNLMQNFANLPEGFMPALDAARLVMKESEIPDEQSTE